MSAKGETEGSFTIPAEDMLSYSHVQDLAQIQAEIRALRASIPVLLSPLLRAAPQTTESQASADVKADFAEKATRIQLDVKTLVKNLEKMCDTLEAAEKVRNEDYNDKGEFIRDQQQPLPLQRTEVTKEVEDEKGDAGEGVTLVDDIAVSVSASLASSAVIGPPHAGSANAQQNNVRTSMERALGAAVPDLLSTGSIHVSGENHYHVQDDGQPSMNTESLMEDANFGVDTFDGSDMYQDFGLNSYTDNWANLGSQFDTQS